MKSVFGPNSSNLKPQLETEMSADRWEHIGPRDRWMSCRLTPTRPRSAPLGLPLMWGTPDSSPVREPPKRRCRCLSVHVGREENNQSEAVSDRPAAPTIPPIGQAYLLHT